MAFDLSIFSKIDFIFNKIVILENFQGSPKFGYLKYHNGIDNITIIELSGVRESYFNYEIEAEDWLLTVQFQYELLSSYLLYTYRLDSGRNIYWNNRLIKETKRGNPKNKIHINFVGEIHDIESTFTLLTCRDWAF